MHNVKRAKSVLLHICCAPCSIECIDALLEEDLYPHGYFYNPNIHPLKEYRARKVALIDYARSVNMKLAIEDEYGLREFISGIYPDFSPESRCAYCYATRLNAAAKYAQANGFMRFTTTLLISPFQRHELIRELGEQSAKAHGVEFLYRDFRPRFKSGQERARNFGLYMQKYCGCIFSEEERYKKR